MRKRVIIAGAAGRDYSNYLVYFKNNPNYEVVAFTATQIPGIEKRKFPKELTGRKKDIPIYKESELSKLIGKLKIDYVFLSYSDLSNQYVMEFASRVLASGANFSLLGTKDTYVKSKKPVIAITAVRTGSGKSQTSRAVAEVLRKHGKKVVAIRHSMPYGNLIKQTCQRFKTLDDFKKHKITIEEEEEYLPWVENDFIVYSGFDYNKILKQAEKEADVIIFDGGNNDLPFIKPDLHITVADPHRAGHEVTYYPGFVNFLLADLIVVNKVDSANKKDIEIVKENIRKYNNKAKVILAKSNITVNEPSLIKGKKCIIVGDGPTLSHGGMSYGAGTLAVKKYKGKFVNPKKYLEGSLRKVFKKFPHLTYEIPAMGYSKKQIKDLERNINKIPADLVVDSTPADLRKLVKVNKPIVEVGYEFSKDCMGHLEKALKKFIK